MGKGNLMSDPIHPNDKGYAMMAEKFHKVIKPYL
jgi:lysophospholipase L1-like esterase